MERREEDEEREDAHIKLLCRHPARTLPGSSSAHAVQICTKVSFQHTIQHVSLSASASDMSMTESTAPTSAAGGVSAAGSSVSLPTHHRRTTAGPEVAPRTPPPPRMPEWGLVAAALGCGLVAALHAARHGGGRGRGRGHRRADAPQARAGGGEHGHARQPLVEGRHVRRRCVPLLGQCPREEALP